MNTMESPARRRWIGRMSATLGALAAMASVAPAAGGPAAPRPAPSDPPARPPTAPASIRRLCTFGDSVLDCGRYNDRGLDPGQLLVRNDDALFPEFRGRDLRHGGETRLEHRAVDGATSHDLASQARGLVAMDGTAAIVSVGGNDLLRGLAADTGPGIREFEVTLRRFVEALPIRPVVLATVYDPTFGDDARNFLGVPAAVARANHRRVNEIIGALGARAGGVADLHAHFLTGDPGWFTRTIESSLIGASEIRRVFLGRLRPG